MKFSRCNGDAISSPSSFRPLPSGSYTPLQTMRPALPAVQISLWAYLSQTKDMAPFDTLSVLHHFGKSMKNGGDVAQSLINVHSHQMGLRICSLHTTSISLPINVHHPHVSVPVLLPCHTDREIIRTVTHEQFFK